MEGEIILKRLLSILLAIAVTAAMPCIAFTETSDESEAQSKYQDAKNEYLNIRTELAGIFAQWEDAGKLKTPAGRRKFVEENLEIKKLALIARCDIAILRLEHVKVYVDSHDFEDEVEILAAIDVEIAKLQNLKADIASAETLADFREIEKKVIEAWRIQRIIIKRYTGLIIAERLNVAWKRLQAVVDRLDEVLVQLEEAGIDISEYEQALDKIKQALEDIRQSYEEARNKFLEIKEEGDLKQLFETAHNIIKEANQKLRDNYYDLKELVKNLREDIKSLADSTGGV